MANYDMNRLKYAISNNESGGDYSILGPMQKDGSQAVGRYQVMSTNIPQWTKEAIGREVTPEEFRNSREIQDKVFEHRMGGYAEKYGPAGAASMWFSGSPNITSTASDSLGTSVPSYVSKFLKAYDGSTLPTNSTTEPQVAANTTSIPTPVVPTVTPTKNPESEVNPYTSLLQAAINSEPPQPQRTQIQQQLVSAPSTLNNTGDSMPQQSLLNLLFGNRKIA